MTKDLQLGELYSLLGDPDHHTAYHRYAGGEQERDGYALETLVLDSSAGPCPPTCPAAGRLRHTCDPLPPPCARRQLSWAR